MELKRYQSDTLATLRGFFEEARVAGPKSAYELLTNQPEQARRLGRYRGAYHALAELPDAPYVCLRLPTGGGKTILAAHSIAIARDAWVEKDYPMVLWLVPTTTIRLQTVEALKNRRHPYRQVLDQAFGGRVRVFDIADFTLIRPCDIRNQLCLVVGTIQALRVSNTEGRKVYAHNEDMEPHFTALKNALGGLETRDGGGVKYSFANLMHIHRPLMIVDEAHNAVTGLTREMQRRVNPCAVIEFTATPRLDSNILHTVSAQELKLEEMIKLPIMLAEHDTWQGAVSGAVAARAALDKAAKDDMDYIRPIVLLQAQPRDQEVTVKVLRQHLIDVEQIREERVAIATGDQRELDGIDLFDPDCPVQFIVTMEALKEGWDCSFAYVFCSVSRIQSAVDVEQLLGRVLRMPYASRREDPSLNKAYAFLSEPSFGEAARALADKLVAMGFDEVEALDSIESAQLELGGGDGGLGIPPVKERLAFRHSVIATPEVLALAEEAGRGGLTLRETGGGRVEIAVAGKLDGAVVSVIFRALSEPERGRFMEAVAKYREEVEDPLSPAERGDPFVIPRLMAAVQGHLEFADSDVFMESHAWSVLDYSPRLTEGEFAVRETARSFEIDLDGNHITYQFANEAEQLALDVDVEGWTPEGLVLWLDGQVRGPDIRQAELLRWLSDLVRHLVDQRGLHIVALMRCKFILARKIREKIASIRQAERGKAYQLHLLAPDAKVEVSFENGFEFTDGMYWDQRRYRGRWRANKHFLGPGQIGAFDGADEGEEFQCAQAIDSLTNVRFWIRNVARHPSSFWLPTATDRFYPDFVAQLDDGRLMVIEYKGGLLADTADTQEKRTVGRLWEKSTCGRGLFIIVEREASGLDMRAQLTAKLAEAQG